MTKQKTLLSAHTRIESRELSKMIASKTLEATNLSSKVIQKLTSMDLVKLAQTERISNFLGFMTSTFQWVVGQIDQKINRQAILLEDQQDSLHTDQQVDQLEKERQHQQKQASLHKANLDQSAEKIGAVIRRWYRMLVPLVALTMGDVVMNTKVFVLVLGDWLSSIALGLVSGVCIYFWAHHAPSVVDKYAGSNKIKRLILFILISLPILFLFEAVALLRLKHMELFSPVSTASFGITPQVYVLVNYLAFVIGYHIVARYRPTKEDLNRHANYTSDIRKIQKIHASITKLTDKRNMLKASLAERQIERDAILQLGKQLEEETQTNYEQVFAQFKLDLLTQSHGEAAGLFTGTLEEDLPKLKLNYQDIEVKDHATADKGELFIKRAVQVLCIASLFLAGCSTNQKTTNYHHLLIDQTQRTFAFQADTVKDQQVEQWVHSTGPENFNLQIGFITDRRCNAALTHELVNEQNTLLRDELKHLHQSKTFIGETTRAINDALQPSTDKHGSLVFYQVSRSINNLKSKQDANHCDLYVLSDLLELSDELNLYDTDVLAQMKFDKDSIARLMDEHFPIDIVPNRTVHLHLVYRQAESEYQDFAFERIASFLSWYYPSKGVEVSVHSSFHQAIGK